MGPLWAVRGRSRRRCMRLLRRLKVGIEHDPLGCRYYRGTNTFRDIERLHRAGLVTAAVSKGALLGALLVTRKTKYPFRELAVFLDEGAARARYPWTVLPRRGR